MVVFRNHGVNGMTPAARLRLNGDPVARPDGDQDWMEAWRALISANGRVVHAIERYLSEAHRTPLTWFDVRSRLRAHPERRMRMQELSELVVFTSGGLSRLVDRMEAVGYLARELSPEDRRGIYVCLTPRGEEKFDEMNRGHMAVVKREFAGKLAASDISAVRRALEPFREG